MIEALFPGTNLSELRSRLHRMPSHLALLGACSIAPGRLPPPPPPHPTKD